MFMLIEKVCWLCLHKGLPDCFNNEMFYGIKYSSLLSQKGQGTEPSVFPLAIGSDFQLVMEACYCPRGQQGVPHLAWSFCCCIRQRDCLGDPGLSFPISAVSWTG